MDTYDPHHAPDPMEWVALDEGERIAMVAAYHRQKRIKLPNSTLHAAIHVVVENQIIEEDAVPTARTLVRLMHEGLDRHDALHAIGHVLDEHLHQIMRTQKGFDEKQYTIDLDALTAKKWRKMG